MKKSTLIISVLAISLLSGCGLVASIKHDPQAKVGAVVLTPTGDFRANKEFAKAYEDRAFVILTEAVKSNLPAKYRQKIIVNARSESNISFTDWYSPNQVNLIGMKDLGDDALLIDYGFSQLSLKHYLDSGVLNAEGAIGIIFIDPKTGKVVGKVSTFATGYGPIADALGASGETIAVLRSNESVSQVPTSQIDAAFQRLINRLVAQAIKRVTE